MFSLRTLGLRLSRFFVFIFKAIFGNFQWSPPLWVVALANSITWPAKKLRTYSSKLHDQDPRRWKLVATSLLLSFVLCIGGTYWWFSQPEPHRISFEVTQPSPTSLEKDAKPFPLVVVFSGSAASIDTVGKALAKGIKVTPPLEGSWRWATDAQLEFLPLKDWEIGKRYTVSFDKNLFAAHVLLQNYRMEFQSPAFTPSVKQGVFYEDPTNPRNKQVVVTLAFTHPVDKSSLERHISLKMRVDPVKSFADSSVKPLGFKVLYNEKASEAYIRSDVITIPDRDAEVLVSVEKGVLAANGGTSSAAILTRTVQVPGIENYFRIRGASATTVTNEKTYQAERIITIESTAAVSQKELASKTTIYLLGDNPDLYKGIPSVEPPEYDESNSASNDDGEEEQANTPIYCPLQSAGQVTPKMLSQAQRLEVNWVPTEQEYSQIQSMTFKAPEGRCLLVKIEKGTKSFGDYPLVTERSFLTDTKPFTPDVRIIGEGALLSLTGDKKLSVMTRNLDAVQFRLFRILPNALHHLTTQTESYGKFAQPEFNYNFGSEQISEVFTSTSTLPPGDQGTPRYATFDFNPYLNGNGATPRGLFILEASGWDPIGKYNRGPTSKRLVLLTDIGFLVKEAQFGVRDLYVTSITQGGGVSGATIEILGKNGIPIFKGLSNEHGHLLIPSLKQFKFEKDPTVYVVQKDGDLAFMPFDQRDRSLNFSRFDIGGLYTVRDEEALQAFLFSDRGIYRPGETAHVGLIVKRTDWAPLPQALPLELSIIEPRGREIVREAVRFNPDGFIEYSFPVSESAITGSYQLQLSLVRPKKSEALLGSTTIRVDEFIPDRLKIDAMFSTESTHAWSKPDGLSGKVSLRNLFGTPAIGNTVRGTLRLTPALPPFPEFREYSFYDPFKAKSSFNETVGDVLTDDNGDAAFDLNLARFEKGLYQLNFIAEGFEKEGGRSVIGSKTTIINPLPYLVGFKADGDRSFVKHNSKIEITLIAIDQMLKKTESKDLTLELIEKRYVSVLTKLENGSLAYQSVEKKESKVTSPLSIGAQGHVFSLPTQDPGSFVYLVKDPSGLVLTEIPFTVVGTANITRDLERTAELNIKLDKSDYLPGQEIQIQIQAPYAGSGLITIERDKVYASKWFTADTTSSIQTIQVPEGLEGNGYVNVAFVRSLHSPEVFMSPLSYGVEPFAVSRSKHTQEVTLSAPDRITPGEILKISVSTKAKARTTVFAIDEGILQVARYRKPDPISHFYRKRALEVNTTQILDLILPEFQILSNLSAAGGDEDALLGRHRNPFKRKGQKPVIFWSGILETSPTPTDLEFPIPDYFNGSIKIFALSVDGQSVGVNDDAVTVQGDLVVSPHVPMVAAPGDEFEVSAVVTNTKARETSTRVSIETGRSLQVIGESSIIIPIEQGRDAVAVFKVKALDSLGDADIKFMASNGKTTIPYTINLSVRPAAPLLASLSFGSIKAGMLGGRSVELSLSRDLYPEMASRSVSASTLPLGMAQGLLRYLEHYPNGCSEQITSQVYPALMYIDRPELGVSSQVAEQSINRALTILSSRQSDDGSFKTWPGFGQGDPFLSIHIIRFIIEAKGRNITISDGLYNNAIGYLTYLANRPVRSLDDARNSAYAIYVLTLDSQVTTTYLQALHSAVKQFSDTSWQKDLTALYMSASYALLQMKTEANSLWKDVPQHVKESNTQYQDTLFHSAQYLLLTAKHFPEMLTNISPEFLEKLSEDLSSQRYNTISASVLSLALSEYQKQRGKEDLTALEVSTSQDNKTFTPLTLQSSIFGTTPLTEEQKFLRIASTQHSPVFYTVSETGFDKGMSSPLSNGIEVIREYRNKSGEIVQSATIGEDIEIRIVLRAIADPTRIGDVAVIDLLPAGFELANGSLSLSSNEASAGFTRWIPHFTDAREDRALLYGMLGTSALEYTYTVKAVSKGDFVIPPIQVEAMYNQQFIARSQASRFIVR